MWKFLEKRPFFRVDMAGLGKYCMGGYGRIGVYRVNFKLPKHETKATIGNRGFLMYKKYRCSYKHISNSIRNILKWFAALKREVSLESSL